MSRPIPMFALVVVFATSLLWAQTGESHGARRPVNMAGQEMSTPNSSSDDMASMDGEGSGQAIGSMQGHHMDMGPHMKMTAIRDSKPGDQQRADQVVHAARKVAEKYADYRVALADGFRIFMSNVPQKMYHFTNYSYAFEAASHFNPEHPTSLLYERNGDGYKLIGLMYTAPKNATEEELDSRIPLSVAQWHAHVHLCMPPAGDREGTMASNARFGLAGSIAVRPSATLSAGNLSRRSSDGWSTCIPSKKKPRMSGPSNDRETHIDSEDVTLNAADRTKETAAKDVCRMFNKNGCGYGRPAAEQLSRRHNDRAFPERELLLSISEMLFL